MSIGAHLDLRSLCFAYMVFKTKIVQLKSTDGDYLDFQAFFSNSKKGLTRLASTFPEKKLILH